MLEILHPRIASRDCDHCRKWLYNDGPDGDGTLVQRIAGQNEPRGISPTPCDTDTGCPKGHWSKPKSLSRRNRRALTHYRACKAGRVPLADPLMIHNAYLISEVEARIDELRRKELVSAAQLGAVRSRING